MATYAPVGAGDIPISIVGSLSEELGKMRLHANAEQMVHSPGRNLTEVGFEVLLTGHSRTPSCRPVSRFPCLEHGDGTGRGASGG